MRSSGAEFIVSYDDRSNDFSWRLDVNTSFSKNKVLEMGSSERWIEGNAVTYLNDRYQLPLVMKLKVCFKARKISKIMLSKVMSCQEISNLRIKTVIT